MNRLHLIADLLDDFAIPEVGAAVFLYGDTTSLTYNRPSLSDQSYRAIAAACEKDGTRLRQTYAGSPDATGRLKTPEGIVEVRVFGVFRAPAIPSIADPLGLAETV